MLRDTLGYRPIRIYMLVSELVEVVIERHTQWQPGICREGVEQ